jgi:HlyD family secretion protein
MTQATSELENQVSRSKPSPGHSLVDDDKHRAQRAASERRRTFARHARQAALGLVLLATAGAAAWALRPQPVGVDTAATSRGSLSLIIEESGVTRLKDRFVVSAPVTGSLSRLSFEPGDQVREGDALAELAPISSPLLDERTRAEAEARLDAAGSSLGQARSQMARAAAARDLAEQELARTRRLTQSGALSPQALEQAEFAARMRGEELSSAVFAEKIAKEQLRIARVTLGNGAAGASRDRHVDVLAPVSGQVLRVHQKSAGVVQAGVPLVEVGDPAALEIVVDLLTTDAVRVAPGTKVSIAGWGGQPLSGKVSRIEPSGFTRPSALGVDEQRVNVIVAIMDPHQQWASLGDGYRVEARLVLWQGDQVVQVPSGAVFRRGDGWAVFRVRGNVASLVGVQLGHRGETQVEITAGLSPGDKVIVHPGDRVQDGVRVKPR